MTQKELLYVEDAIGHEKNIISILNESMNFVTDDNICTFLSKQINKHKKMENKLIQLLEEKSNE